MKIIMRHLPSSVQSIILSSAGSRVGHVRYWYEVNLCWEDIGGVWLMFHTDVDVWKGFLEDEDGSLASPGFTDKAMIFRDSRSLGTQVGTAVGGGFWVWGCKMWIGTHFRVRSGDALSSWVIHWLKLSNDSSPGCAVLVWRFLELKLKTLPENLL